jgi:hypothetical protein
MATAERAGPAATAHTANPGITNFVANAVYRDAIRRESPDVMWITFLTDM